MELIRQVGAALAVVGLLAATLWALRRPALAGLVGLRANRGSARRLEILERLALAPHHVLHLVRVDERVILIGQSPAGLSLIDNAGTPTREASR